MILGIILGIIGVIASTGAVAYASMSSKSKREMGIADLDAYRRGERP